MAKYWSATTTSFWDSAVVATAQMPSDKVAITDAEYADLMSKQASGYRIVHNTSTGKPQAVAQSLADATRTVQALDSEVVHKTGDEEIAGEKTFTATPIVENAAPSVRCINTGLTKGTNPSELNISNSGWFDKNSKWLGFYGYQVETDGAAKSYLGVYEFDSTSDSAENRAHIGVEYPKNGTPFGFAPTTPTNAKTNEIVTANWVINSATAARAAGLVGVLPIENGGTGSSTQNFVDLSTAQTVGGGKTWTGNQNVKKASPYLAFQNTGVTKGTAPSSTQTTSITFGSNGGTNAANSLAVLQNYVEASGNNVVKLAAYDPTASSTTNSGLVITYPKGDTPTFTLGGKNVVRSVNGVGADAAGNVTMPEATPTTFGLMRTAAVEDEQDCTCTDAAITPANFADMGDYRQANTSYAVGAVVRCLYHAELWLVCTTAGKTSKNALDTRSVTAGQVLTDGTAKWTVKSRDYTVNDASADAEGKISVSTAPSTPAGSTGKQIVTADWLYNRGFGEVIPEKANQDANLYLTTGSYWLKSTAVNIPVGSNGLLCVYCKGNVTRQVFYRQGTVNSNDYQIYTRQLADPVDGVPTVIGEWVQMITSKDARLVIPGTVIAFAGNPSTHPSGYLLCNGAAVSRTTYAKLFEAIGTTYGAGNGSSTFNLPDLTDKFIQGSGTAGTTKAAGLPNVTGTFRALTGSTSGAFSESATWASDDPGDGDISKANVAVTLNLSASNSIYGASTTVQPPAVTMRFYIKY